MTTYTFNFALADYTLDHMATVNGNIREALNNLERTCVNSMADWTDDAKTAYTSAKATWDANALAMNSALEAARKALFEISAGYGSAQVRAKQIWENTYTG